MTSQDYVEMRFRRFPLFRREIPLFHREIPLSRFPAFFVYVCNALLYGPTPGFWE